MVFIKQVKKLGATVPKKVGGAESRKWGRLVSKGEGLSKKIQKERVKKWEGMSLKAKEGRGQKYGRS